MRMNTREYVLPLSGEVVEAKSVAEARDIFSRFSYTMEEIGSVELLSEYVAREEALTPQGR